ncbi:MAG: ABC transporter substrate-binding protein [Aridibacter sp.]
MAIFAVNCRTNNYQNTEIAPPTNREITDDLGKKIDLPNEITRAVSLAPNLTEIIFAVGAGDKLVGVTSFCNYPQEATKIQKVGDTLKPNIENIIALKPDIVFVSTASQLESFTDTLEKQGIDVFITNPNSLEDIYKSIEKIGEVFGNTERAIKLVGDLKTRVAEVESKTENAEKIKTFVQIDKSLYTIGKESFLTDLIEKAGGVSVTKDVETSYPKISKEKAFALNPDAIILSDSPDNNEPNEVFANSNAVKNDKVFKINADILSRPSPRIVDALEQIAKSLHPEKFE